MNTCFICRAEFSIDLRLINTFISVTGTAEVIVTVGGEDDKVVLRSVESFDPMTSQWKSLACLPFAVSKHGLVVSGECVVLCVLVFSFLSTSPSSRNDHAAEITFFLHSGV